MPRIKSQQLAWQHEGLLEGSVQPHTDDRNEGEGSKPSLEEIEGFKLSLTAHNTGTIGHGSTSDGWVECNGQCSVVTGVLAPISVLHFLSWIRR